MTKRKPVADKQPVLEPVEPEILRGDEKSDIVLICDHASNYIPGVLNDLGMAGDTLNEHIALDIGAADLTRRISELMNVPAVLAGVSRLVIDANREAGHPGQVPIISDGTEIPGNQNLTAQNITQRMEAYVDPFHGAISRILDSQAQYDRAPFVIGVHSFTPKMGAGGLNGHQEKERRPWHIGLMWDKDPRLAQALIGLLERETDLNIGENQPYSGSDLFYTMQQHGGNRGLAHCVIEIRQDLMSRPSHIEEWAVLIANLLDECLQRPDLQICMKTNSSGDHKTMRASAKNMETLH